MLIRPAGKNDIDRMCTLLGELFAVEVDFSPDAGKQARGLVRLIDDASGSTLVLVAETSDVIVGMATVQTLLSTAEGGSVGLVEDVVVGKEYRGRGIGTMLLDEIVRWGIRRKLLRLQLLADKDNQPALKFYCSQEWTSTNLMCMRKIV